MVLGSSAPGMELNLIINGIVEEMAIMKRMNITAFLSVCLLIIFSVAGCANFIQPRLESAEAYIERGIEYRRKGKHDQAIADFNKALEIYPNFAEAYNNRGIAYRRKGQHEQAILDFTKAIEIYPWYGEAYYNRSVTYYIKGKYDKAWYDFFEAKVFDSEVDPALLKSLQEVLVPFIGKYDNAWKDFKEKADISKIEKTYNSLKLFALVSELLEKNYYRPLSPADLYFGAFKGIENFGGTKNVLIEKNITALTISHPTGELITNIFLEGDPKAVTHKMSKGFSAVIKAIAKNKSDYSENDLIISGINEMVQCLDPQSSFFPPEAFEEGTKVKHGGIGIVLSIKERVLTVVSPIEGAPAYKAGVRPDDKIIRLNGESTQDMALWQAVKKSYEAL